MLGRRGWERERERNKWRGWRGIYTPTPESDCCVFSGGARIIRGRDRIDKSTLKFPRSGSSGVRLDHPAWPSSRRSKVTRSGSSGPEPDHPDLLRNICHCWAGSSDPVQKLYAGPDFRGCFLSRMSSQMKHLNNQKIHPNASPLIVRWILYSNSNRKLKLNLDWIHHTKFKIGDLSFIFFFNFSFYSCTHFLQSIISLNCDCQKSPKSIRGLDALSLMYIAHC